MAVYDAVLDSKREIAAGTMAFHFSRPEGFAFKSGQAIDLILPAGAGESGEDQRHTFSLVNAPFQDELCVATRMRDSEFKRRLGSLRQGAAVRVEGPFGSLLLHNNAARAAVFIAGGIGITPFMSMLRHAVHAGLPHRLLLLYSNRRPEDAAFLDELSELARQNPRFLLLATMTQMDGSSQPWTGTTGVIDAALIKQAIDGLANPVAYLAGPPAMVQSLRDVVSEAGVDEDDIRSEDFFGY